MNMPLTAETLSCAGMGMPVDPRNSRISPRVTGTKNGLPIKLYEINSMGGSKMAFGKLVSLPPFYPIKNGIISRIAGL